MELHRYPKEKPTGDGPYLVYFGTYWDVIIWDGQKERWSDWDYYADSEYYPVNVKYWAKLPEIPEDK